MYYNQNFDNSYDYNDRKYDNFDNKEKHDNKNGYCCVKVIQECCYPSYWDCEEKDKKDDKRDNCDKHEDKKDDKKDEKCCCKKDDNKEEHNCCEKQKSYCEKDNKDDEKNSCRDEHNKDDNKNCCCRPQRRCCGFCGCFRRW